MNFDQFLNKWRGRQGVGERAEYQLFLAEFCHALGLPTPGDPGQPEADYRFEAPVRSEAVLGGKGAGRIDLYKRDHFILEAKQSRLQPGETPPDAPPEPPPEPIYDLFGNPVGFAAPATGKAQPRYDRLMADARVQAERYALALPADHRAPPFLIVADIGRAFELYFDWSGTGRGYGLFPDRQHYRITLDDLAGDRKLPGLDLTARQLLAGIWTDPAGVDPRLRAAQVTRGIAETLSKVARQLEKEQRDLRPGDAEIALGIEATSLFLMRLLFCMFAEDVGLLPKDSFKLFLEDARGRSDLFWRNGLRDLWSRMNDPTETNRYWSQGDAIVRYFNGNLFASARIFDLPAEHKNHLLVAAKQDWRAVEPAIFGTLLEQVLTEKDRARLGAHYTPRAYVERLVTATIMDVIRPEWEAVRETAQAAEEAGDGARAATLLAGFHRRLGGLRILDPACGTGNFLYVAMEELLRLETEVLQLAAEIGARLDSCVHPNQFLGLELNPRAAVIAELVLWIGWLRHRLANQPDSIGEPVLPPLTNINAGTHGGFDAVLVRTISGEPDTADPRRPTWPEADFIVGNPPFIGGKDLRDRLGGAYAEALWRANPGVPKSADFVMQWWDRAADLLTAPGTRLRRFGLVTTNSITQVFSRRVIERHLAKTPSPLAGEGGAPPGAEGEGLAASAADKTPPNSRSPSPPTNESPGLSLILAIPDHPWTRAGKDAAAVRIAMTVAEAGDHEGTLIEIVGEQGLDTDDPQLEERRTAGRLNADLTVGTDVTSLKPLKANEGICSPGVKLHGSGFIVTPAEARDLKLGTMPELDRHIRPYLNGRDLLQRPRGVMVIDLFGLSEAEVMDRFPDLYQHLLKAVWQEHDDQDKPVPGAGRKYNRRDSYKRNWWVFGEPRSELRAAAIGLPRYIATVETSKHRVFQFVDASVLPDNMIIAIASDDSFHLGVVQSRPHAEWALRVGGWLGFGNDNRYNKSKVFDPFPFPDPPPKQRAAIAALAERLDATRRTALDENDKLTMTGLYNLVEAVRAGTVPPAQEQAAIRARARIVAKLHDDLDEAVAAAYGWDWPLPAAEIVARLVALNAARAREEAQGHIRWLRPDYQDPRFAPRGKATIGPTEPDGRA